VGPDVTFEPRGELGGSVYTGLEGVQRGRAAFQEIWESIDFEPLEFVERGDGVMVALRFDLRSRTGVELQVDEGWAYWVREGRIVRVRQCPTREEALRAGSAWARCSAASAEVVSPEGGVAGAPSSGT
jgi:ketosteroid isomerase-like protein